MYIHAHECAHTNAKKTWYAHIRGFYSADKNNSYKISKTMDGISKYYFGDVRDGKEECWKDHAKLG